MADRYISHAYVNAFLGTSVTSALTSDDGASLTTVIEAATGLVQTALRNSGYETPAADAVSTTMDDETVKLAVMGAVWELLASRPEWGLALPEQWKEHPARVSYAKILNGDATLSLSLTSRAAVGGWGFSDSSTTTTGRVPRATRTALRGW